MKQFPEYVFSKMTNEMRVIERVNHRKVLNLSAGTPDIPPSKKFMEKLAEFVQEPGAHLYPGYEATPEFLQAIIEWYRKRFGVNLAHCGILPLLGAKDGVVTIPPVLTNSGDSALVPDPGYPAYVFPALLHGVTPVAYSLDDNWVENVQRLITGKTKYIWLNFPANPTGRIVTLQELEHIVHIAKQKHVVLVYDNAYSEITFDNYVAPSILQIPGAVDAAVEIGSFSKSFSFAGFRMGWMIGNTNIIKAVQKLKSQLDSGLSLPLQRLGAYALLHPDVEWKKQMLMEYKRRRDILVQKLAHIGVPCSFPKGGLYLWTSVPDQFLDGDEFCHKILHEKLVAFTPGVNFGAQGRKYIRASYSRNIDTIDQYI